MLMMGPMTWSRSYYLASIIRTISHFWGHHQWCRVSSLSKISTWIYFGFILEFLNKSRELPIHISQRISYHYILNLIFFQAPNLFSNQFWLYWCGGGSSCSVVLCVSLIAALFVDGCVLHVSKVNLWRKISNITQLLLRQIRIRKLVQLHIRNI